MFQGWLDMMNVQWKLNYYGRNCNEINIWTKRRYLPQARRLFHPQFYSLEEWRNNIGVYGQWHLSAGRGNHLRGIHIQIIKMVSRLKPKLRLPCLVFFGQTKYTLYVLEMRYRLYITTRESGIWQTGEYCNIVITDEWKVLKNGEYLSYSSNGEQACRQGI